MSFNMSLWKINNEDLVEIDRTRMDREERLENWIAQDISILDLDLLLIGRQVSTDFGGRIDLLGIDRQGDITILELKRDKTPREVVAQILDYASWVNRLSFKEINAIASKFLNQDLSTAFNSYFGEPLPEKTNTNHSMVIIASELDESSERIVRYLADEHDININVIFFNFFRSDSEEILGRAWLMDPEKVQEKAEARKQPPWSGYWYVNVGEGIHRNWDDDIRYGFIGAGQGNKFSRGLKRLDIGDKIFAYLSGTGYVGYGEVTHKATMIKDFVVEDKPLLKLPRNAPQADDNKDDPEMCEWVVGVNWLKTYTREEAKTFKGVFACRNVVCKLRDEATVKFLEKEFDLGNS
jgi:hypothetical protein